jgi:periplasmic divalent cation tolerance protein
MNFKYIIVLCACPSESVAIEIAALLVDERLAACVNRVSGVRSTYLWEGELRDDAEVLLIVKTSLERYPELELRLKALHPYEVPEIIAVPIVAGAAGYLAWLGAGCDVDSGAATGSSRPVPLSGSTPSVKDPTP